MEVKAKVKYIRISPRKVRLVVDAIRGLGVKKAFDQLDFINKRAAKPIKKLIESGVSNAENNFELKSDNLFVKEIKVDEGPTFKRWMPRAYGRATPIRKRTSHINLTLGELVDSGEKKGKKPEVEDPIKLGEKKEEVKDVKKDNKKEPKKEKKESTEEKGKEAFDQRSEGRGGHTKIEGGSSAGKKNLKGMFRRKTG
jgi:large subunit ribosomal protein L22